ncbi:hypothetical protein L596_013472 [Steinernema carpocapsae]|uniref:KASH domain-containing protein n=1 Tax=Steinernema carpocapsae TaxID=34508 RepID=A0A4U5P096_STECR|nr:hypothetical protein L596_013472 [Steinernema carpocapsae]
MLNLYSIRCLQIHCWSFPRLLSVIQLHVETEGSTLIQTTKKQLDSRLFATNFEKKHKSLEVLTEKWHLIWLRSLGLQARIEKLIERREEKSESDSDSETSEDEPERKRRRTLSGSNSENPAAVAENLEHVKEDEDVTDTEELLPSVNGGDEDTIPFEADEYEPIGGDQEETAPAVGSDDVAMMTKTESETEAPKDIGYSSGENSMHESTNTLGDDEQRMLRIQGSPVKSYYKTVPLDDAGVTDTETPRGLNSTVTWPQLEIKVDSAVDMTDSMIVNTESPPRSDDKYFQEVMQIMDECDLPVPPIDHFKNNLENLKKGTEWREFKPSSRRVSSCRSSHSKLAMSRSISDKTSCDASSEESDDPNNKTLESWVPQDVGSTPLNYHIAMNRKRHRKRKDGTSFLSESFKNSSNIMTTSMYLGSDLEASIYTTMSEQRPDLMSQSFNSSTPFSSRRRSGGVRRRIGRSNSEACFLSASALPLFQSTPTSKGSKGRISGADSDTTSSAAYEPSDAPAYEWDDYKSFLAMKQIVCFTYPPESVVSNYHCCALAPRNHLVINICQSPLSLPHKHLPLGKSSYPFECVIRVCGSIECVWCTERGPPDWAVGVLGLRGSREAIIIGFRSNGQLRSLRTAAGQRAMFGKCFGCGFRKTRKKPEAKDESTISIGDFLTAVHSTPKMNDDDYGFQLAESEQDTDHKAVTSMITESKNHLNKAIIMLSDPENDINARNTVRVCARSNIHRLTAIVNANPRLKQETTDEIDKIEDEWKTVLASLDDPQPSPRPPSDPRQSTPELKWDSSAYQKLADTLRSSFLDENYIDSFKTIEDVDSMIRVYQKIHDRLKDERNSFEVDAQKELANIDTNELQELLTECDRCLQTIATTTAQLEQLKENWIQWTKLGSSVESTMHELECKLDNIGETTLANPEMIYEELEDCQNRMGRLETVCNFLTAHLNELSARPCNGCDYTDFSAEFKKYSTELETLKSRYEKLLSNSTSTVSVGTSTSPRKRKQSAKATSPVRTIVPRPTLMKRVVHSVRSSFAIQILLGLTLLLAFGAFLYSYAEEKPMNRWRSSFGPHLDYIRGPPPV